MIKSLMTSTVVDKHEIVDAVAMHCNSMHFMLNRSELVTMDETNKLTVASLLKAIKKQLYEIDPGKASVVVKSYVEKEPRFMVHSVMINGKVMIPRLEENL